jgi:hypothetical protein
MMVSIILSFIALASTLSLAVTLVIAIRLAERIDELEAELEDQKEVYVPMRIGDEKRGGEARATSESLRVKIFDPGAGVPERFPQA